MQTKKKLEPTNFRGPAVQTHTHLGRLMQILSSKNINYVKLVFLHKQTKIHTD